MTAKQVTQIRVHNRTIGIVGLDEVLQEMACDWADRSDEDAAGELLRRLSKTNYIPEQVADLYGKAFVREFRKYLGQPFEEEAASEVLEIKILGVGCARCDWLRQAVIDAVQELRVAADVTHITDLREIARYPVLGSPALVMNGTPVCVGSVPSKEQIKQWIRKSTGE
jgi:small redox-active disulfide protein 2